MGKRGQYKAHNCVMRYATEKQDFQTFLPFTLTEGM